MTTGAFANGGSGEDWLQFVMAGGALNFDIRVSGSGVTVNSVLYATGFEHFELLGSQGHDTMTGGAGEDVLARGNGNDTFRGIGGSDVYEGGLGNDTYILATSGDTVVEAAGAGTDTVRAGYSLALMANVENLVLTGTSAVNGTGNTLANSLTGNGAANSLAAGAGNDVLTGGLGNDAFVFNAALSGTGNVDTIRDMNEAGNDTIRLENAVFTALTQTGVLKDAAFRSNLTGLAQDSSDRIIFERDTGEIYYDSNGSTAGGTYVLFAKVDANSTLPAADFWVF